MGVQSRIVLKCDDEVDVDGYLQRAVLQRERCQRRKHASSCLGGL